MQCSIWASDVMLRSPAGYLMGDPSWRRQEPLPRLLSAFHRWQKQALDLGWDDVALLLFVQTSDEWAQVFFRSWKTMSKRCRNMPESQLGPVSFPEVVQHLPAERMPTACLAPCGQSKLFTLRCNFCKSSFQDCWVPSIGTVLEVLGYGLQCVAPSP